MLVQGTAIVQNKPHQPTEPLHYPCTQPHPIQAHHTTDTTNKSQHYIQSINGFLSRFLSRYVPRPGNQHLSSRPSLGQSPTVIRYLASQLQPTAQQPTPASSKRTRRYTPLDPNSTRPCRRTSRRVGRALGTNRYVQLRTQTDIAFIGPMPSISARSTKKKQHTRAKHDLAHRFALHGHRRAKEERDTNSW